MTEPVRHVDDAERRNRLARRHAIHPGHRVGDAVAATRAMTVLHSTEPPTPYLSLQARVDGLTRADVDRALYDDRSSGQAARHAADAVRLPARPAAGGVGERLGPGRRPGAEADHQGRRDGWPGHRRRRVVANRARGRPRPTCGWRGAERAGPARGAAGSHRQGPRRRRHQVGSRGVDGAADPRPARCGGPRRARPQRQPLAGLAAAVDLDGGMAGGGARAARRGGGLRRARTPMAAHLRTRDRDRHRVVAGLDQERGAPGARRRRGRAGLPRLRRHGLPAAPTTSTRSRRSSRGARCCRCSTRR